MSNEVELSNVSGGEQSDHKNLNSNDLGLNSQIMDPIEAVQNSQAQMSTRLDSSNSVDVDEILDPHHSTTHMTLFMNKLDHLGRKKRIDYVLAFTDLASVDEKDRDDLLEYRRCYLKNLKKKGLEMENDDGGETKFIKLHIPYHVLFNYAEQMKMKLPLKWNDSEVSESLVSKFLNKFNIFLPPTFPEDDDDIEDLAIKNPYNYFTAEFDSKYKDRFALADLGEENFFTIADRNRVVRNILDNTTFRPFKAENEEEGSKREEELLGITRLLANGAFTGAFPLHDGDYKLNEKDYNKHWIHYIDELNARQKLYYAWANPKAWYKDQPMDPIRRYFGEKVAMYFSWLGYYTYMLMIASVIGLVTFAYGLATMGFNDAADALCGDGPNAHYIMCPSCDEPCQFWLLQDACVNVRLTHLFDNDVTVIYSIFMALWATMFLELWKRKQNELQYDWDLFDFEESQETLRPEFEEMAQKKKNSWLRQNPVTQSLEPFMPFSYKLPRLLMSLSTVLFMMCVVVGAIVGVVIYRVIILGILNNSGLQSEASSITSGTGATLNLVAIMVFSFIYQKLATKLTDIECPRTQTEYEDSYTLKMFVFQFVNYYSSIIYIAFFKGTFAGYPGHYKTIVGSRQEECQPGGCLLELTLQLLIVMVGKQFINNVQEIGVPIIMEFVKTKKLEREEKARVRKLTEQRENGVLTANDSLVVNEIDTTWERDYLLSPQPPMNLFGEYLEMVIQFGFTVLFATAFPLAPLFAFVNNVIEVRLDAFKFVSQMQRPWAQKAQDIGSWYAILESVGVLAVLFNAFIIAVTSTYLDTILYRQLGDNSTETFWDFVYTTANATRDFQGYGCEDSVLELYNWTQEQCTNDNVVQKCYYKDYRFGVESDMAGEYTEYFYKSLAAKFIFVTIFEHLVFFIKVVVAYAVPDMPGDIKVQQLREQHLTKTYLYKDDNEYGDDDDIDGDGAPSSSKARPSQLGAINE